MTTSQSSKDSNDFNPNDGPLSGSFHGSICSSRFSPQNSFTHESMHGAQRKELTKTLSLDRSNDQVYSATTRVVKAIMALSQGVEKAAAIEYLELVKNVGIELRALLSSVDILASIFPPPALK